MTWPGANPIIREIECGMEINMYGPDARTTTTASCSDPDGARDD